MNWFNDQPQFPPQRPGRPIVIPIPGLHREVGAGDVVKEITQAAGVKPCTPCEQRRRALNARVQFGPWGT